jgi:hypothetical protein
VAIRAYAVKPDRGNLLIHSYRTYSGLALVRIAVTKIPTAMYSAASYEQATCAALLR